MINLLSSKLLLLILLTRNSAGLNICLFFIDYDLIMVNNILKLLTAFKECGSFAGITIISPCFR